MTTLQMTDTRPVQYKIAVIAFILCTAVGVILGMHHFFWLLTMWFTPPGIVDYSSPFVFGYASVTVPVMIVAAMLATFLWQLIDVEA
ncbi:hypothetical protein Peetri_00215 [Pseudomonas phage vB_PpuM-Peetri]